MKKTVRYLSLVLALMLAVLTAAACGETGKDEPTVPTATTTGAPAGETEAPVETDIYSLTDNIPDTAKFNGTNINILYWKSMENEWVSEGISGDVILDAIFQKNSRVQERLGVTLEFTEKPGNGSNTEAFCNEVKKTVDSGEPIYSLVSAYSRNAMVLSVDGYFRNLKNYSQIELSQPWYCKSAVDAVTVGKYTYCLAGAISHSYLSRMAGCFFNSELLDSFHLEDPYDLVLKNEWTLEKFLSMQEGLWIDLDTDGVKSAGDQYGVHTDKPQIDCLQYSGGIVFCDYDENHIPKLSNDISSEKIVNICDYWIKIMENGYVSGTDDTTVFSSGRAAFYLYPMAHASSEEMRAATFPFGFVPQPKYDKNQENYIVSLTNYFSLWGIPISLPNSEESSAYVIEAMSAEGFRNVVPAMFEIAYKYKYTNDSSSRQAQIFDMMRENVHVDFGKVCTLSMNNIPATMFRDVICGGYNNYMTKYNLNKKSLTKGMQSALEGLIHD